MTLPFEVNVTDLDICFQGNLIDLQSDEIFQDSKIGNIMLGKLMALLKNIYYSRRK